MTGIYLDKQTFLQQFIIANACLYSDVKDIDSDIEMAVYIWEKINNL